MTTRIRKHAAGRLVRLVLVAGLIGLPFVPVRARLQHPAVPPDRSMTGLEAPFAPGHPKMQSSLSRLLDIYLTRGQAAAAAYAADRKMDWRNGSVRVVSEAEVHGSARVAAAAAALLRSHIQSLGGAVETTHRQLIQHYIPLASLAALAGDPAIRYVRLPLRPVRHAVVSEGVALTGADLWKSLDSFRGANPTKVCVLDTGFMGYTSLLGTELPKTVTARSFRADGDMEAGSQHGAACAEIVYDMAPNAQMYLVCFDTDVEQHNAVDYIVSQGITAISYSLGWFNAGAGDGTGPIDADVEYAAANKIAWASSAGNAARDHWNGDFTDPDGNGWLNFSGSDELLDFFVPAGETVGAFLNWKDWGPWDGFNYRGTDQDYDLYLYYLNGSTYQLVDASTASQTGTEWPTEEIYGYYSDQDAYWAVAVRKVHATKSVPLEFVALGNSRPIQYYVTARSIQVPADSVSALTAGAVYWADDSLELYSSNGPTWDGRLKPDFASPDGVSTKTYGNQSFFGTSSSAPHLAGAIALLRGMTPYTVAQIKDVLIHRAIDLGAPGPDTKFGNGRLNLKKK